MQAKRVNIIELLSIIERTLSKLDHVYTALT